MSNSIGKKSNINKRIFSAALALSILCPSTKAVNSKNIKTVIYKHPYLINSAVLAAVVTCASAILYNVSGDLKRTKLTLTEFLNAPINADGTTLLMRAAKDGNSAHICRLLDNGADPEVKDAIGHTALTYAVINNQLNSVRTLLEYGANATASDNGGYNAIDYAAINGNCEIMKAFLALEIIPKEKFRETYQLTNNSQIRAAIDDSFGTDQSLSNNVENQKTIQSNT